MRDGSWASEPMTPEQKLHHVIAATFVIRTRTITAEARLVEDLSIDGEDAFALFSAISDATGTNFSNLYKDWSLYFKTREEELRDDLNKLGVITILILSAVTAHWYGTQVFAAPLLAGGFLAPSRREPIRVRHVITAIERRYWA